ncbi:MAG: hypothetical protein WCL39_06130, partial [Armatimonadota bacterium]
CCGIDPWAASDHADTSFKSTWRHPTFPITASASWAMPPTRIKPGEEVKIAWNVSTHTNGQVDGETWINLGADSQPSAWDKGKKVNDDQGSAPATGTYRFTFQAGKPGDVKKFCVQAYGAYSADGPKIFSNQRRTFTYTYAGDNPVSVPQGINIIWQSTPGITFTPPTSQDLKTSAQFDRMGKVKVWAEVQIQKDGVYETIGETDQTEVNVTSPKFILTFEPAEGQGKVGQEIKATVTTEPAVEPSIIEYVWESPVSANRMTYEKNESVIGFKLKDATPIQLQATARVPTWLDIIGPVTGTYTASAYTVKALVIGISGPRPRVWKEGVGPVDIEKGSYASDERVTVKATIEGNPPPSEVHWKWSTNEGTSIAGGGISQETTITRHETGTAEATVEATGKDGVFLGKATATFQVSISADDLKKAQQKGPLSVILQAPRQEIGPKEVLNITATVTGGKDPYRFAWQGVTNSNGSGASLTATKIGKNTVALTVTDSDGATGSASIEVDVYDANLRLKLESDKPELVVFDTAKLGAIITGGKPPYVVKWGLGAKGAGKKATFRPTST